MTRGKKITAWISGVLGVLIIALVGGVFCYGQYLFGKMDRIGVEKDNLGINEEVENKLSQYDESITNIALFGIDSEDGEVGRSDSIIIATVDKQHKKLKLTSIMRDSYVDIPERGMDKINHAYAFGDAELAIRTLNENFDLNIEDFVAVNFTTLPLIIDKVGGVNIDITNEEVQHILGIDTAGTYNLTGDQALSYSRIRYADGGDYVRTERQRTVLTKLFEKIITISPTQYPGLLNELLPMVKTSLSTSEIISMATDVVKMESPVLEQQRFPLDGYCYDKTIDGIYYLDFDKAMTVNQLHGYIFEDLKIWE